MGAREVRRRLEACEAFGGWSADDARRWWQENGEAVAGDERRVEETEVTLTRHLGPPGA